MKKTNRIAHASGKVRVSIGAPVRFPPEMAKELQRQVEVPHWPEKSLQYFYQLVTFSLQIAFAQASRCPPSRLANLV
jgi:hypothetical protein